MEVARDRGIELCRTCNVDPSTISDVSPPRPLPQKAAEDVADGPSLPGSSLGQPARSGCPSVAVEIPYGSPPYLDIPDVANSIPADHALRHQA